MIKQFEFNHFGTNCYVLSDGGEAVIVDPGMVNLHEDDALYSYIDSIGAKVVAVVLTHAHVDHIAGLRNALEHYGLPVGCHSDSRKLLRQASAYGSVMGFEVEAMDDLPVQELKEGNVIKVGSLEIECREVPGHCEGSLAFVVGKERKVITGDALFRGSIGRTDLPGGNYDRLAASIREKLLVLEDDYSVLPGHGDCSTIGDERNNPFLFGL